MRFVLAENLEAVQPNIPPWQELADSQEDELFSTPEFLLPLLEHYPISFALLFIYAEGDGISEEEMVGFVPLQRQSPQGIILSRHLTLLSHPHCGWLQPYFHPDYGEEAAEAMLQWCRRTKPQTVAAFHGISEDSFFYRQLRQILDRDRTPTFEKKAQRAIMRRSGQPEKYLQEQISAKKRKQLRNRKNRLRKNGKLQVCIENGRHKHHLLLDTFLDLDDRSTKGQSENTALYSIGDRQFFHDVVENIGSKYTVSFACLLLDDHLLAMQLNIERKRTLFGYKTTHDPQFKKFSPGILLEVEIMARFQNSERLTTADSCTEPGSYIEQIWKERRTIWTVIIPLSRYGRVLLQAARFLSGLKKTLVILGHRLKKRGIPLSTMDEHGG